MNGEEQQGSGREIRCFDHELGDWVGLSAKSGLSKGWKVRRDGVHQGRKCKFNDPDRKRGT